MYTNLVFETDEDICDLDSRVEGRAPYLEADHVVSRYRSCQKQKSVYCICHYTCVHWSPFARCSVYNKPTIICVHSSNQTEHNINNSINSSACDTTAPEPTVLLTGIHWLLVISI